MRILVLSGYHAASHAYWCSLLPQMVPEASWLELSLPPRHFSWRTRGSSLAFATIFRDQIDAFEPTLIMSTSMVDVAALRGFMPQLANIPWLTYFHENQFAYPDNRNVTHLVDMQLTSIYSAIASDIVVFNSAFNRDSFVAGAKRLFKRLPDFSSPAEIDAVVSRSKVLPVPIATDVFQGDQAAADRIEITWNHRWEYDKGPDRLALIVQALVDRRVDFRLNIVGQQFRDTPPALRELISNPAFLPFLGQVGFVESRVDYLQLLASSSHVLSTAIHDFQGLSLLEGAASGCSVVAPNRLAYPEWFSDACYHSDLHPSSLEAEAAVEVILAPRKQSDVSQLSVTHLASQYRRLLHH